MGAYDCDCTENLAHEWKELKKKQREQRDRSAPKKELQKPTGYWIGSEGSYICSRCGNDPLNYIATMGAVNDAYMEILMDFCPCCGAHMVERKNDETVN